MEKDIIDIYDFMSVLVGLFFSIFVPVFTIVMLTKLVIWLMVSR